MMSKSPNALYIERDLANHRPVVGLRTILGTIHKRKCVIDYIQFSLTDYGNI